jgi:dTDP-4-dehydrorhamnose 3,5-epimerase
VWGDQIQKSPQDGRFLENGKIQQPILVVFASRTAFHQGLGSPQPPAPRDTPKHHMPYTATRTRIPDVIILEPKVFGDSRGFFLESFNAQDFAQCTGLDVNFVQDNHSRSAQGVLRGLHYQLNKPQGKLVRVVRGRVFDVAVDVRKSSPTFGQWAGIELSEENNRQLWVPAGFAHGFVVLSESADFLYKTTDYYDPSCERSIAWNDPAIGITWPSMASAPLLSAKDQVASLLAHAEVYP